MDHSIKEAIVLAGGLGTRLRGAIGDIPKPLAEVNGRPFLHYLFVYLAQQEIETVVLSVGCKWEMIQEALKSKKEESLRTAFFAGSKLWRAASNELWFMNKPRVLVVHRLSSFPKQLACFRVF